MYSKQTLKNTAWIRTFISNPVECQVILVEFYPFTQIWLLHFTEIYVVVFVTIGIFPSGGWKWKNKLETTTYKTISSRQGSFSNPAKALILAFGNFPPKWIDSAIPFTQKVSSCKVWNLARLDFWPVKYIYIYTHCFQRNVLIMSLY